MIAIVLWIMGLGVAAAAGFLVLWLAVRILFLPFDAIDAFMRWWSARHFQSIRR